MLKYHPNICISAFLCYYVTYIKKKYVKYLVDKTKLFRICIALESTSQTHNNCNSKFINAINKTVIGIFPYSFSYVLGQLILLCGFLTAIMTIHGV